MAREFGTTGDGGGLAVQATAPPAAAPTATARPARCEARLSRAARPPRPPPAPVPGCMLRALLRARPGAVAAARRALFIKIEPTPNPDSLKFLPEGRAVFPAALGSGAHFSDARDARGSKLVRTLLKYTQITGVFLGPDFVSVNKVDTVGWDALKPIVLGAIMDAYAEFDARGAPIVEAPPPPSGDTAPAEEDGEVVAMIKELIETRVRPAVQEDGGDIFYV